MIELPSNLGLLGKLAEHPGIALELRTQHLDGHAPPDHRIARPHDHADAAPVHLSEPAIAFG